MLKITNIKIYKNLTNEDLINTICQKFHIALNDIVDWKIIKKSIDARKKDDIHYNYSVAIKVNNENKYKKFEKIDKDSLFNSSLKLDNYTGNANFSNSPVIIGAGPAGLFSALTLIYNGVKPIIIEQGKKVEDRQKDVENFRNNSKLNTFSNVQFGEGGAGTFSDGKLNSGINSTLCKNVLYEFVKFGAPEEILYISKPHIGTDKLINIIKNIREFIIANGGKFYFSTKAVDFNIQDNQIKSVICQNVINKSIFEIPTKHVILAIGHSSRDTFNKVYEKGLLLEPKNFSVGVRIEHLQSEINNSQYGNSPKLKLPPAEYKLAYHSPNGRSCYTFCMCPGGVVMASSSEENTIVTNGMSNFLRDEKNANSAVLVNVTPQDFDSSSPLAGIDFQKSLEEKAFILGGANYFAPVQRFEDFCLNKKSEKIGEILPSYLPGYTLSNLREILPKFVSSTLIEGIKYFDTKLNGFANPDSILTGVETRSSSPVRILRNEKLVSNIDGIFPCGEGAGYAGGIMSASVDGIRCGYAILEKYS